MAWTLDVAQIPTVNHRLRKKNLHSQNNIQQPFGQCETSSNQSSGRDFEIDLYACDVSDRQFPPQSTLDEFGITVFEHDVSQPFSKRLHGKFDLIHMRLLVFALSEKDWGRALRNLKVLLSGYFPYPTVLMRFDVCRVRTWRETSTDGFECHVVSR